MSTNKNYRRNLVGWELLDHTVNVVLQKGVGGRKGQNWATTVSEWSVMM